MPPYSTQKGIEEEHVGESRKPGLHNTNFDNEHDLELKIDSEVRKAEVQAEPRTTQRNMDDFMAVVEDNREEDSKAQYSDFMAHDLPDQNFRGKSAFCDRETAIYANVKDEHQDFLSE